MKSRSRGFMAVELLGALAIGSLMLAGLAAMIDASIEDAKGQQAAYYHLQVVSAANKYVQVNYSTLAVAANTTSTTTVSLNDLIDANLLPPGLGATNAYGQTPCVLIRVTSKTIGGQPVYFVNALVVGEGTAAQAIPERTLYAAAAQAGRGSGAISTSTPTVATGSYGAWKLDETTSPKLSEFLSANCSGNTAGGGSLVSALFYDGPGQLSTDFLYRNAVTGHPELNQMNTPLKMAVNAIVNENDPCGGTAAIAFDSARNLLNCDLSGVWKRVTTWKHPVATFSDLPGTDSVGDVRMTLDTGRAFMYDTDSSWRALAVDQNGDLFVSRDINVTGNAEMNIVNAFTMNTPIVNAYAVNVDDNVNVKNSVNVKNNVNVENSVNASNNVNAWNDINGMNNVNAWNNVNAENDVNAFRNLNAENNVNIGKSVTAGGDVFISRDVYIGGTMYGGQ